MDRLKGNCSYNIPGSARPVVSSMIWSKAPLRCINFSMAATPLSLMLQQRQPFASSRNSSEFSADGSSGDDTLIAFAERFAFNNIQRGEKSDPVASPSISW